MRRTRLSSTNPPRGQVFGLHDHCREPLAQFGLPRRQLGEFRGTSVRPCTDCPAATVNDRAGTPTCQAHDVILTADKESQSAKKHSTQSPLDGIDLAAYFSG
jgi:hypothetical protein